jgi:hypothetical protein
VSELHPDCPSCLRPLGRRYVAVDALTDAFNRALVAQVGDPQSFDRFRRVFDAAVDALSEEEV